MNSNESSSTNMKKICSSEFSNPDLRPYVVMTYSNYHYTINNFYDTGYAVRFSTPQPRIVSYNSTVAQRFLSIFGVELISTYTAYESSADLCKGNVTPTSINNECIHNPYHLTNNVLRDDLPNGTDTASVVIWTGHIMAGNGASSSSFSRHSVVITPMATITQTGMSYINKSEQDIQKESVYSLMHELSHQLGAPDHYCYGSDDENGKCANKDCDRCVHGTNPRACIMSGRDDISTLTDQEIYCEDCRTIIANHLYDHH